MVKSLVFSFQGIYSLVHGIAYGVSRCKAVCSIYPLQRALERA